MGGTRSLIHGLHTDTLRTSYGLTTGMERACHGRSTVLVLSRDACRAGACVFVRCSFCVRSSFGRVLCGVRLVLVRVAFVRGGSQGEAADCGRRRVHIRTWDWSLRDTRRTLHGPATDLRRTSDGRRKGGHSSDADILRHSKMGGARWADATKRVPPVAAADCAAHGLETDTPRTAHGLETDTETDFPIAQAPHRACRAPHAVTRSRNAKAKGPRFMPGLPFCTRYAGDVI